jgi:hypothetical protein
MVSWLTPKIKWGEGVALCLGTFVANFPLDKSRRMNIYSYGFCDPASFRTSNSFD